MAILIPEVIINNAVNMVLKLTREDYESKPNKKDTVLYRLFGEDDNGDPLKFHTFVWFNEAVSIIVGDEKRKREVEVHLGYNLKRMEAPNIHIMLPNETPIHSGIGDNEGYEDVLIDEAKQVSIPVYTQDTQVTYNLLITSDNYHEVLVLYHFMKGVFLSIKTQMELQGLQNTVFGGSDMTFDESLVPVNIFHRNFNLSFTYDYSSIDFFSSKFVGTKNGKLNITGKGMLSEE